MLAFFFGTVSLMFGTYHHGTHKILVYKVVTVVQVDGLGLLQLQPLLELLIERQKRDGGRQKKRIFW